MRRHRFSILVAIASISVTIIISLQVYWLYNSFEEQRNRFYADIENALTETSVMQLVSRGMTSAKEEGADRATVAIAMNSLLTGLKNFDPDLKINNDEIQKELDSAYDAKKKAGHQTLVRIVADTTKRAPVNVKAYQEIMKAALSRRKIDVKPEIAIVGPEGNFIDCTTDSATFAGSPVKSSEANLLKLPVDDKGAVLEAAFPNGGLYLLRKMAWLLALSIVFITLFILSFIYLLSSFFRQKKLSAIKTDFINNMTHELKTPISSMSVALELVEDAGGTVSQQDKIEYLQIARGELRRLSGLVEKVLTMAAFEKKEIRINPEKIVLKALLDNVVNSFRPVLERHHATVSVKVTPELLVVTADKMHFSNVIHNLMDNALKYNDKEQPQIDIMAVEKGNNIVICVKDNGKGIPKSYIEKVFDNFFRIPAGDLHDVKGYGIGLSYVKAVAVLHGGTVSVESVEGEGSTFIITIPKQ
ncbi:sensor histidine kinase [Chitinophagaceae bacterium MMS25-I14]